MYVAHTLEGEVPQTFMRRVPPPLVRVPPPEIVDQLVPL
jgi:hypothetical protein